MAKDNELKNRAVAVRGGAFPPDHPKNKPDIREAFGKSARQEQIDHIVAVAMGDILDESFEWDMGLESAPMWHELRDAIMQVIYSTEREFGRQESSGRPRTATRKKLAAADDDGKRDDAEYAAEAAGEK